jgi:GntR family transcriptional regulator / MocR family aminotransferase
MLTYSFEGIGSENMYEHIYRCIRQDIHAGRLVAGERLPSKREFARNLGVSLIVVENAYAQLKAEGYIHTVPKRGYFVSEFEKAPVGASYQTVSSTTSPELDPPKFFADFVTSAIDVDMFPYALWTRTLRNMIISESETALLLDTSTAGVEKLRKAIARHLLDFRGLTVDPEQIIVGAGTQFLYNILVQLFGRERAYAIEDPGYVRLGRIYEANGVDVSYIPLDDAGILLDKLVDSGANTVHVMPSHQFPTGIVMPVSRRYELLGWASQMPERYIIEDDHDCEFRLVGKPIPTLQSVDVSERVIYVNTFSRSLSSTFRISYMILPPHLLVRFKQKLGFYSCSVSNFEQFALARFIEEGHFERHINRMKSHYRSKRDLLIKELVSSPIGSRVKISKRECGLHFLLHVDTDESDADLVAAAAKQGLRISCLSAYHHAGCPSDSHTIVLNYSGVSRKLIPRAASVLSSLLD